MQLTDQIQIRYTPAQLAAASEAEAELSWLADIRSRDPHGRLDAGVVAELRSTGWLRQDGQRRGGYLSTHGLAEALDHPELVLENVPSAFAASASELLTQMAEYLLKRRCSFEAGEIYGSGGGAGQIMVTFADFDHQREKLIGDGERALLVVPLP